MARAPTLIGERIAVLETTYPAMDRRLEKLEQASERQDAKLDLLLKGQELAASERAGQTEQIRAMAPNVQLVENARRWIKATMWVSSIGGGIIGALLAAKGWILLNWNWFLGR